MERFHDFLNHSVTIIRDERQTPNFFVEATIISAYAWNIMPVDGIDIERSISTIGRPLRFPMDVALAELPQSVNDSDRATVSYIRNITRDARFAKDIVIWLTEERRERHHKHINSSRCVINGTL